MTSTTGVAETVTPQACQLANTSTCYSKNIAATSAQTISILLPTTPANSALPSIPNASVAIILANPPAFIVLQDTTPLWIIATAAIQLSPVAQSVYTPTLE